MRVRKERERKRDRLEDNGGIPQIYNTHGRERPRDNIVDTLTVWQTRLVGRRS